MSPPCTLNNVLDSYCVDTEPNFIVPTVDCVRMEPLLRRAVERHTAASTAAAAVAAAASSGAEFDNAAAAGGASAASMFADEYLPPHAWCRSEKLPTLLRYLRGRDATFCFYYVPITPAFLSTVVSVVGSVLVLLYRF